MGDAARVDLHRNARARICALRTQLDAETRGGQVAASHVDSFKCTLMDERKLRVAAADANHEYRRTHNQEEVDTNRFHLETRSRISATELAVQGLYAEAEACEELAARERVLLEA